MGRQEVVKQLEVVKAMNLPKMNYEKLKKYHGEIYGFEETEENIKIMDEYLGKFLDSKNDYCGNGCWICGNKSVSLTWGLSHGSAFSDCCGLVYEHYHYPKNIGEENLFNGRIERSLQYHPDGFEIEAEEKGEE